MTSFEIGTGYIPGIIGRVTELHGRYYQKNWGFGPFFETKVASELSGFLDRYDAERDALFYVTENDRVEGSIIIDGIQGEEKGAHLRWFIASSAIRSRGAGRCLMEKAMIFCHRRQYPKIYLWTFEGLTAARSLYKQAGFTLTRQQEGVQWGTRVNEQLWEAYL